MPASAIAQNHYCKQKDHVYSPGEVFYLCYAFARDISNVIIAEFTGMHESGLSRLRKWYN